MATQTFTYETPRNGFVITKQVPGIDGEPVTLVRDQYMSWVHPIIPQVQVFMCSLAQYEAVNGPLPEGQSWTPYKSMVTHTITLG